MKKYRAYLLTLGFLICTCAPTLAFADQTPAQLPATCERACKLSNAGRCTDLGVTGNPNGDPQCAGSRIGIVTYTKLSTFGNAGGCVDKADNNRCASGSCTSFQGKLTFGVAHRTFPFGTRMEVCNVDKKSVGYGICNIATVVERGPDAAVGNVTVDARAELGIALKMECNGKIDGTYKVLSVPGIAQTAEPSGPAPVGIETILAMQQNGVGAPVNGTTYTAANTPWGQGYLGTPPPAGSSAYNGMGAQNYGLQTSQTSQTSTSNSSTGFTTSTSTASGSVGPAAGNIMVQPHRVSRGQALIVSWTSVNMSPNSCKVMYQGQQFATGNEGSKRFVTVSSDSGTLAFTLSCTDTLGQSAQSSDSATVQ